MGLEIERKFLVDHKKWGKVDKAHGTHYRQGYILMDKEHTVRVRISEKRGFLNLKSRNSQMSHNEYEYEIPLQEGREILDSFTKNGTEKVRFRIPFKGKTWEVDEFMGDNAGLVVAEIELKSEEEEFEKPDWVTTEVTDDSRYKNSCLAVHPFKDW